MRKEVKIGDKFGRLEVISAPYTVGYKRSKKLKVTCRCECGTVKDYYLDLIRRGHTKSCGCFQQEARYISKKTHGHCYEKIYRVWMTMKARCINPNAKEYHNYGARGIRVCDEWFDFMTFYKWAQENGYKEGLTIERNDYNGNYEPSNCRWASAKEQSNNTRRNHLIEINGVTHTLSQWCEIYNRKYYLVERRINYLNWEPLDALTRPKQVKYGSRI